jgi:hypothetical protein
MLLDYIVEINSSYLFPPCLLIRKVSVSFLIENKNKKNLMVLNLFTETESRYNDDTNGPQRLMKSFDRTKRESNVV